MRLLLAVFVICILFFGLVGNSYAHKSQTVGDYDFEIGWKNEPPILGETNAIELAVTVSSESNGSTLIAGSGISGLADDLESYVSLNGKKTSLLFAETDKPGVYVADFSPAESGHPMVNVYAIINSTEIETSLHPEKIKEVDKPFFVLTEKGTLKISLETEPVSLQKEKDSKLKIEFINPQSEKIQEHVDYNIEIIDNEKSVFGPIPLTHTSKGSVVIPYIFEEDGSYTVIISVEGVLFQPMPTETAQFGLNVGSPINMEDHGEKIHDNMPIQETQIPSWIKQNAGWWAEGTIDDDSFIQGIQFLIREGIMKNQLTVVFDEGDNSKGIPTWVRNNAGWWAKDIIADSDFISGIQYLVSNGIMDV